MIVDRFVRLLNVQVVGRPTLDRLVHEEQVVGYTTSRRGLPKIAVTMCCFIYLALNPKP